MKLERIAIVGGGIGGMALAAALSRLGFKADVYERAPELSEVGAGVGLWSNALHSLDQLGAADAVRATCTPLRVMEAANGSGRVLSRTALDALGDEFARAACYVVHRATLLDAIRAQVPATWVHTGRPVAGVRQNAASAQIVFDDGAVEAADLVVGADGFRSVVRPAVVGDDTPRYSAQTCFRGIADIAPAEPTVMREVQGVGQRCAVNPISAKQVYWWAALNHPEGKMIPQAERKAWLVERFRGWPFGIEDAVRATSTETILQNDLCDRTPVRSYVKGRLVLLGDAAHPTTPNLGQGANMAIDDGLVLARALHREATLEVALARYQRERLPRTTQIVERSWSFGRMCTWTARPLIWARETMLGLTPASAMRSVFRWQILENVGDLQE